MTEQLVEIQPNLIKFSRKLCRYSPDMDYMDLVQDANKRIIEKQELFKDGTNLLSWSFTLMHNLFINKKRRKPLILSDRTKVDYIYLSEERHLNKALRGIKNRKIKTAMICRFKFNMSYNDIAEFMGEGLNSVKTFIRRGRELIIKRYENIK